MKSGFRVILSCSLFASIPSACSAGVILSVVSASAPSASQVMLQPGQTTTFDVMLSGIDPMTPAIGNLSAEIDFDASLLGTPFNVTAGGVVSDPSSFVSAAGPGQANGTFSILVGSSSPITTNGTLFSFQVTAQMPPGSSGAGIFTIPSIVATDPDFNLIDSAEGTSVSYTVTATAVPEPSSLLMLLTACGFGLRRVHRARSHRLAGTSA
ncbi:hypothetical protein OJF2_05630 [Aquisphaera giovannonii]|uniref:Uncharacterized protein n=1 Tax=Aquisphaera giovannonii TaxID=406548 RepID=A0A5B9VVJ5_9BACT|nr:PEP-CTERM sorting domain-containing protein [Aquisphaera giovannonii]QEH32094.1 hypothetical protein OJF2_05630 [Aquisphaera giovannonii]